MIYVLIHVLVDFCMKLVYYVLLGVDIHVCIDVRINVSYIYDSFVLTKLCIEENVLINYINDNNFQGFEHVTNMEGGYSSWVDSGLAGDKDQPSDELKVACKFRP